MISDADKAKINDAIRAAESKTSGGLYCVLAQNAGGYRLVPIAWASATSSRNAMARWPAPASSPASASTRSSRLAVNATAAPSDASNFAKCAPKPPEAPVTTATSRS